MIRPIRTLQALSVLLLATQSHSLTYTLEAQDEPLFTVNDKYLSICLDTTNITTINLTHPNLRTAVRHLGAMYMRIGGTEADDFFFEANLPVNASTLSGERWLEIASFAKEFNLRMIYDLNALLRDENNTWISDNAEAMLQFSQEKGLELDWQMGNEPDLFPAYQNTYVDPKVLANDFIKLRSLMDKYGYNSSALVGPSMFDVGRSAYWDAYFKDFLEVANPYLDAVTCHHYYFNASGATFERYIEPELFNQLEQRINAIKSVVNSTNRIWLDETSSAFSGGIRDVADRFIAGFLWLDKLGLSAQLGVELLARQTIWGNNYSLLDREYNITPDWWLSILYKKLVGTKVLSVTHDGPQTRVVRLYAHCAKSDALWGDSAVVVFGFNVANVTSEVSLNFNGITTEDTQVFRYELTSDSGLFSKTSLLNGNVLELTNGLELPEFASTVSTPSDSFTFKPYSLVFWVYSNVTVKACQ